MLGLFHFEALILGFVNVYAPNSLLERGKLWGWLSENLLEESSVVYSDFNEVVSPINKSGGKPFKWD